MSVDGSSSLMSVDVQRLSMSVDVKRLSVSRCNVKGKQCWRPTSVCYDLPLCVKDSSAQAGDTAGMDMLLRVLVRGSMWGGVGLCVQRCRTPRAALVRVFTLCVWSGD